MLFGMVWWASRAEWEHRGADWGELVSWGRNRRGSVCLAVLCRRRVVVVGPVGGSAVHDTAIDAVGEQKSGEGRGLQSQWSAQWLPYDSDLVMQPSTDTVAADGVDGVSNEPSATHCHHACEG